MPLITSKSPAAFSKNVETEIKAGKPQKQAVAIAYAKKNEAKGKDESKQDEACRLFKAGKTVVDISQRLAVPENTIERWVGYIRAPNTWYGKTKDSLPLPIAVKKAKLAAHNAGLTEAQDLTPVKVDGEDFSKADEDAYFKRRKEIQTKLDRERPDDDTNRLRAHEQTLRERGEKVTPYRAAAEDTDPRKPVYKKDGWKVMPTFNDSFQVIHPNGGLVANVKSLEEAKKYIATNSDEGKDASPSETLEVARKAEVAQDHACALDAYRAAAHGFRQAGDQRSEQVARDGIAACQRQAAHGYSDQYEHPSRGKVQAFDSAERALESAVERTRAGEDVALEEEGTVVAPAEDARDPKAWALVAQIKALVPKMKREAAKLNGDTMRIYEEAKELKSDVGELHDEAAWDAAKNALYDVNAASSRHGKDSPPSPVPVKDGEPLKRFEADRTGGKDVESTSQKKLRLAHRMLADTEDELDAARRRGEPASIIRDLIDEVKDAQQYLRACKSAQDSLRPVPVTNANAKDRVLGRGAVGDEHPEIVWRRHANEELVGSIGGKDVGKIYIRAPKIIDAIDLLTGVGAGFNSIPVAKDYIQRRVNSVYSHPGKDSLPSPVPVCDESTNAPWICPYDGPVPTRKCPYCGYDCKKNTARDEHEGFAKLEHSLAHRKGITDPDALAASIGRKKYGAKGMAAKSAAAKDSLPLPVKVTKHA